MTTPTNPNAVYTVTPLAGVNFQRRTNTSTEVAPIEHMLGTIVNDFNGKVWVYCRVTVKLGSQNFATIKYGTKGSVAASSIVQKTVNAWINGTAAFSAGDFGWVQSVRRLGFYPPAGYTGSGP